MDNTPKHFTKCQNFLRQPSEVVLACEASGQILLTLHGHTNIVQMLGSILGNGDRIILPNRLQDSEELRNPHGSGMRSLGRVLSKVYIVVEKLRKIFSVRFLLNDL